MRLSRFLLIAAFFTSACAAAPVEDEEADETQSNGTVVVPEADLYLLDTPSIGGDLEIRSVSKEELLFSMELGAKTPPNNTGQIGMQEDPFGKAKKNDAGSYVYKAGDCTLTFTGAPEAINVVQDGECFGVGVNANGKFHRAARKPALGEYEINTKTLGGTLTVESVDNRRIKVSLSVSRKDQGAAAGQGDLEVMADRRRTSWRHESKVRRPEGGGCFLDIKVAPGALDVTQKEDCGFPMSLGNVTGIYKANRGR